MIAIAPTTAGICSRSTSRPIWPPKESHLQDFGTDSTDSCDYPIFGHGAAEAVASGRCERGIVICTTGIGISISANKVRGIRCALCSERALRRDGSRRHNDANMLALGSRDDRPLLAERIVDTFLTTAFEGGRHQRRVDEINVEAIENEA